MITALAIMIAVAGYLQFAGTNLDKEEYLPVSGEPQNKISENIGSDDALSGLLELSDEDLFSDINSLDSDVDVVEANYLDEGMQVVNTETPTEGEIPGEAIFTSTTGIATLTEAKMLKEQVRSKNKETLLEIINSAGLTDVQKQNAVDTMVAMTAIAEKEMAAEILLEAKGFSDVVVSIEGNSVDVVVNAISLTDAQRAQIEDIVKRKTEVEASNIIISTVVQ